MIKLKVKKLRENINYEKNEKEKNKTYEKT